MKDALGLKDPNQKPQLEMFLEIGLEAWDDRRNYAVDEPVHFAYYGCGGVTGYGFACVILVKNLDSRIHFPKIAL